MRKLIFIFLFIILFLSIFSSKQIHYDDTVFMHGADYLIKNGYEEFKTHKWMFHGYEINPSDGTHSFFPIFFYAFFIKILNSLTLLHILIYVIFASAVFPLNRILQRSKIKNPALLSSMLLLSPVIIVNANSFMSDIPGFVFFVWGFEVFLNYEEKSDLKSLISFFILFAVSILFTYINLFILFIVLIVFLDSKKRKHFSSYIIFYVFIGLLLGVLILVNGSPTLIQSARWFGSEKMFNYHQFSRKAAAFLMFFGLLTCPVILLKNSYKNPIFYMSAIISAIYAFTTSYPFESQILIFIFASAGLFSLSKIVFESENKKYIYIFSLFSILSIIFLPMVVSRYMLLSLIPVYVLVFRNMSRRFFIAGIALNITFSALILYSDMLNSKSYQNLDFAFEGGSGMFSGEWGYRNTAEKKGLFPLRADGSNLTDSSILFIPDLEAVFQADKSILSHLNEISTDSAFNFIIKPISKNGGSGFYTNMYGPLPFSVSREYGIRHTKYVYTENPNAYLKKYEEILSVWKSEIVIPCNINDTIAFDVTNDLVLKIVFFPDNIVVRKSDGIKVFVTSSSISENITAVPGFKHEIIIPASSGITKIYFSSNGSPDFDWFGIVPIIK